MVRVWSMWGLLAGAGLLLLGHGSLARQAPPAQSLAIRLYDDVRTHRLDNGLRIYLKVVPNSPVVTTMVAYRVGSCDEDKNFTGLSHYLEHLMFKGTEKLMPGQIDRLTLKNGGANNAYTSEDMTVYYFDFAADRWEVALDIEADRMRNIRIDAQHEFQQEKGAVIEELARNEDQPWDLELKAIMPRLFGERSPYGHPVIGERDHVRAATAEVIKAYYDRWYHPNNAALVVVGGFDPDAALAKIKQRFDAIPAGKLPERPQPLPADRAAPVRHEFPSKFEVARLVMGFNTIATDHPDYPALEVLQAVLSGGKTSRLYQRMVEGDAVASLASAGNYAGRHPGWFAFMVELLQDKDPNQAEKILLEEVEKLRRAPVGDAELRRVKRQLTAATVFGRESVHELADSIARAVVVNDLDWLKELLPRIQAVSAADVQRVANTYLDPQRRVAVWSMPKKPTPANGDGNARIGGGAPARDDVPHTLPLLPRREAYRTPPERAFPRLGSLREEFSLKATQRIVLPNGLTLLILPHRQVPVVYAEALVKHVGLAEPANRNGLANLMGAMLDEGTTTRTSQQIAEQIESVGGELGMSRSGGSVKVLADDYKLGLELLIDCLTRPNFPAEPFERMRERILSEIADAERQPAHRAAEAFRGLVYGSDHPLGRSSLGNAEVVQKLTPADCLEFHRRVFSPKRTILVVVGDLQTDDVVKEITRLTADWKDDGSPPPEKPAPQSAPGGTAKYIPMPEAAQAQFFMGHLGVPRQHPDFYKLLVMEHVLGTGPGFTDRLSARLRDREGLAYTVSATITPDAGEMAGTFSCYIGTDPRNLERARKGFLEEIDKLRKEPPSPFEVTDVQQYLIGRLAFAFTTNQRIAGRLLQIERYGLGMDFVADYRKAVAAVTPADVQAMAAKHIVPERLVIAVAGAIDEQGKPLPPPKRPN